MKVDHRPILMGLNHSEDPDRSLLPDPPGCAGHQLWSMCYDECGITRVDWVRLTRRGNLLTDAAPIDSYKHMARERAHHLRDLIGGEIIVLLGVDVAEAFGHREESFVWSPGPRNWIAIPHPSGRNLYWTNPVHRAAAGVLLRDIIWRCHGKRAFRPGL